MDALEPRFQEASYPVHSYPELSIEAWLYKDPTAEKDEGDEARPPSDADADDTADLAQETARTAVPIVPYSADDILKDGCFASNWRAPYSWSNAVLHQKQVRRASAH